MDIATILGIVIALGSIIGGQILEGGHVGSIMQLTAFIIVIGGTFGAICIQNPLPVVIKAFGALTIAISGPHIDNKGTIQLILELANISRKQGLLALEGKLKTRSYEDKEGVKRYVTEIIGESFILLDKMP